MTASVVPVYDRSRWSCQRRSLVVYDHRLSSSSSSLSPLSRPSLSLVSLLSLLRVGTFIAVLVINLTTSTTTIYTHAFTAIPLDRVYNYHHCDIGSCSKRPASRISDDEQFYNESTMSNNKGSSNANADDPRFSGKCPPSMLRNEFSRTIATRTIESLHHHYHGAADDSTKGRRRSSSSSSSSSNTISIAATEEECKALAERFDLSGLESLTADVTIRPSTSDNDEDDDDDRRERRRSRKGSGGGSSGGSQSGVLEVEGTIYAQVQQTCVRTGETFDATVEFPVFSMVYPISGGNIADLTSDDTDVGSNKGDDEYYDNNVTSKKSKKKKSKRSDKNGSASFSKGGRTSSGRVVVDLRDVFDLQAALEANERMLEEEENENQMSNQDGLGSYVDLAATSIPFEDEAIYCTYPELTLDVGELIAQSFYEQLDPYPVKDRRDDDDNDDDGYGSSDGPVEFYSITG